MRIQKDDEMVIEFIFFFFTIFPPQCLYNLPFSKFLGNLLFAL